MGSQLPGGIVHAVHQHIGQGLHLVHRPHVQQLGLIGVVAVEEPASEDAAGDVSVVATKLGSATVQQYSSQEVGLGVRPQGQCRREGDPVADPCSLLAMA